MTFDYLNLSFIIKLNFEVIEFERNVYFSNTYIKYDDY